jgi:hypothetical protein
MDDLSPFLIEESGDTLRIAWDYRRVRKYSLAFGCLLIFWIIWAPLTLLVTAMIFIPDLPVGLRVFFIIWSIFGWLGTLVIPYGWLARTWSEWIEVSKESFSSGYIGFLSRKSKTFPVDTIAEVACGFYTTTGKDRESLITLSVIRSGGLLGSTRRHLFGSWLATRLKVQIFETIEEFVKKNRIPLKMARYGALFGNEVPEPNLTVTSKPRVIDKNSPIEVSETEEMLRLQWITRRISSKRAGFVFLVVFLSIWITVTFLATYGIFQPNAKARIAGGIWLIFGYGGILLVGYRVVERFWTEWIEVSKDTVSHGRHGFLAGKPKIIPLESVYEFGLSKNSSNQVTISYGRPDRRRLRRFGFWISPEYNEQIFQTIEDFVVRKEIPLRMVRYGP